MKLLITGGLGFQGSHLTEHFLKKGYQVSILNTYSDRAQVVLKSFKKKPRVIWGSITDWELVRKSVREHDVVFHLAAHINVDESIREPKLCCEVNIGGTLNVLEAVKEFHKRLIHTSTCEVYGAILGRDLINETAELRPHSPYAASKAAADRLCFAYFKSYGLNVTIVRPFNIFGPRQKEKEFGALIPILVRRGFNKEDLVIFGDGRQTRDYMYISDLVKAYDLILNAHNTAGEVYNFGTGQETMIKDIAHYIAKKFGVRVKRIQARSGEVARFRADSTQAEKFLGFKAKIDIWTGIDRYIAWRKKQ